MKQTYVAFIMLVVILFGCDSATEVPANRKSGGNVLTSTETLKLSPDGLNLFCLDPSSAPAHTMLVFNNSETESVRVETIELVFETAQVEYALNISADLPVTLGPIGSGSNSLTLEYRFFGLPAGDNQCWVKINGEIVDGPILFSGYNLLIEDVDFGTVNVGENKEVTFRVINRGKTAVQLHSAFIGEGGADEEVRFLNLPSLPVSIAAQEELSLRIMYSPVRSGNYSTNIRFEASGPRCMDVECIIRAIAQ